jgi:predicted TIM-barrel fold metal-dependent hydrolase
LKTATSPNPTSHVPLRRRTVLQAAGAAALGGVTTLSACGGSEDAPANATTSALRNVFIADSVSHGYNYSPSNRTNQVFGGMVSEQLYKGVHVGLQPDDPKWRLSEERFNFATDPGLVGRALFDESPTDFTVYHEVPFFGLFKDGSSDIEVGKAMRTRWGADRVALYGGVSAVQPDAMDRMDRLAQTPGVVGIKLYPGDLIDLRWKNALMSDRDLMFPVIEKARSMGLKSVAVHKAIYVDNMDPNAFNVNDVGVAAKAFPEMTFEIVHGGYAFLPETLAVLRDNPNVVVNLEGPSAFILKQRRGFEQIMAAFLRVDPKAERLIWATGCVVVHPLPFLEAFWEFQFPQAMLDAGTPPFTEELKRRVLGGNIARILGIGAEQQTRVMARKATTYAAPWSGEKS